MTHAHQPTVFKDLPVTAAVSSIEDGTMKFADDATREDVVRNIQNFLKTNGSSIESTTLVRTIYGAGITFDRILDVTKDDLGKGMLAPDMIAPSDALFTTTRGQTLFLPIADCGGVVIYDDKRGVLGLVHLGRHATFDGLAEKSIQHMMATYGSQPADVHVWISPAISGDSYWLHTFDHAHKVEWQPHIREHDNGWFVDLQGFNVEQFVTAGVPRAQIERSTVDTATNLHYPSHYAASSLDMPGKTGRLAVMAFIS